MLVVLAAALLVAACVPFGQVPSDEPVVLSSEDTHPVSVPRPKPDAPDTSKLRLVFGDEFDGDALDTSRWHTQLPWGPITNERELQYNSPRGLRVADGVLTITARKQRTGKKEYTSGLVSSHGKFEFRYGYVEIRARTARGQGLWPALWMMAAPEHDFREIDIGEFIGGNPYRVQQTLHWGPGRQRITSTYEGTDFAGDFHTFAVAWKPDSVVWYVDGIERFRQTEHIPDVRMYVVANMAVGGNYAGPPDATTRFPAESQVDYIRVYSWD